MYLNLSSSASTAWARVRGAPPVATWKGSLTGSFLSQLAPSMPSLVCASELMLPVWTSLLSLRNSRAIKCDRIQYKRPRAWARANQRAR